MKNSILQIGNKRNNQTQLDFHFGIEPPKFIRKNKWRSDKMASIRESALTYKPKETKNIAELEKVSCNLDLKTKNGATKNGEEFAFQYILVNNEEYRVPSSVLKILKILLEITPEAEYFRVLVTGTGMQKEYTVMLV